MSSRIVHVLFVFIMALATVPGPAQGLEIVNLGIVASDYDIGRDNNDGVHIIWKTGRDLFYGRIENGIVQSQQQIPFDSFETPIHTRWARPRISVRPDGKEVHTCWIYQGDNSYGYNRIHHVWRDQNGNWHGETAYSGPTTGQFVAFPSCGADASGTVHMIAQRYDGSDGIIYGRKPPGGSWSWTTLVGAYPVEWRHCTLTIGPSGGVHATWKGWDQRGQYRYCPSGGSLVNGSGYTIPKGDGSVTNSMGDTFVGAEGRVHHAFISYNGYTVDYSVKPTGGVFGAASNPSLGMFAHFSDYDHHPDVAADKDGNVVVVYAEEPSSTPRRISRVVASWGDGHNWQKEIIDDDADIDEFSRPVVTATDKGGYLVWRTSGGYLLLAVYTLLEDFTVAGYSASYVNGTIGEDTDFLIYKLTPQGDKQWRKNLGGDGNEEATSIRRTGDGGTIVAGWTDSYVHGGKGDTDFLVYKLNSKGQKEWRKNFGGDDSDAAYAVRLTSDGGYVVVGETASYVNGQTGADTDFLLYKINAQGQKIWRKNFGGDHPDRATAVCVTPDGGFVVVGESYTYIHGTPVAEDRDFLLYRLSATGNKLWRKNLGGELPDTAQAVRHTTDGCYVVAGHTDSYVNGTMGEDTDFLIYKINAQGNKVWRKNYGGSLPDRGYDIIQTEDGGYLVVGETESYVSGGSGEDSDMLVYKLNAAGNKSWRKNYGGPYPDRAFAVSQTVNGNYYVIGTTFSYVHGPGGEDSDFLILKLDADGNLLWQKNFGGDEREGAHAVH